MMNRIYQYITIILCLITSSQIFAQSQLDINQIESDDYNSKVKYYKQQAENILNGNDVNSLSDQRFYRYMTALNSEANCYYMLDNYNMLGELASKFQNLLNNRLNLDEELRSRLEMYGNKIWGSYYYGQTQYSSSAYTLAESYYFNSLKHSSFDKKHTDIISQELAQLYYKWGLTTKAQSYFKLAFNCLSPLHDDSEICSQEAMCLARMGQFEENTAIASKNFDLALNYIDISINSLKKNSEKYAEALRKKGKILMIKGDRLGIDYNKEAKECYNKYISYQKKNISEKLSNISDNSGREQYWLALHQFLYDCVRLGNNAPDMLYDLVLFSKGFLIESKHNNKAIDYKWNDVKKKLDKNDCAIEFVAYNGPNEAKHMGALVIKKNSNKPKFIDIGNIDSIMNLKAYNGRTLKYALSSDAEKIKNVLFKEHTFFNSVWTKQLLNEIGNSKRVFFSPDGFIHQLAIEYMIPEGYNFTCHRLSSTRVLLKPRKTNMNRILLCGDVNFNSTDGPSSDYRDNDIDGYYTMAQRRLNINPLPGTRIEVDSIYNKLKSHPTSLKIDTLTGKFATENRFRHLASSGSNIVHIATHGYFIGTNNFISDLKPAISDKSMSESGLIMAGAASNINNPYFVPTIPDGFLTAKELSNENLKYVDLMVLSACQTGMGYITDDGVYGIIKGLKEAGVGATIVSLWKVNDASTCEIMKRFYAELMKDPNRNIHLAFNKARQSMIENGKVDIRRFNQSTLSNRQSTIVLDEPFHTNAFILIDAW